MKSQEFDVIVIGGGTIGLSAAYYSASSGLKVLLLEQHGIQNNLQSSSGHSRFYRMMYSEKNMAKLAETSYALWKQLEVETSEKLIEVTPLLFFGSKNSGDTVEGDFQNTDKIMNELGIPYKNLNQNELVKEFPLLKNIPENYSGLIQKNSGVIRVQKTLEVLYKLCIEKNVSFITNKKARILDSFPGASIFKVKVDQETFKTKKLILAPGAWTNQVIEPLKQKFKLKIWEMTLGYFRLKNPTIQHPFWYEFGESKNNTQTLFYGFPQSEDTESVKVSADFTFKMYDDVSECARVPDPQIIKILEKFMENRFENIIPKLENAATCLYTMSSDYHMILGLLPGYDNVAILTGESGRAFKYTPLFGRILSELAREGGTDYNLSGVSINRPGLLC
jgi:monomeric sarcosine oxidase